MKKTMLALPALLFGMFLLLSPHAHAAEVTAITDLQTYYVSDESAVVTAMLTDTTSTEDVIEFGTESGNYTDSINGTSYQVDGDSRTYFLFHAPELHAEAKYYYRIKIGNVTSSEGSFTTKASSEVTIDSISPTSGSGSTTVTITGKGFGDQKTGGVVYFGNCGVSRTRDGCAEIISWSDTKIVVKPVVLGSNPSVTGTVGIRKEKRTIGSVLALRLIKAFEGPTFTLTKESTTNTNATVTNTNSVAPDTNTNESFTTNTTIANANDDQNTNAATALDTNEKTSSIWGTTLFWGSVIAAAIVGFLLAYFFQKRKA